MGGDKVIKNGLSVLRGELEGYASTSFALLSETKTPAPQKPEARKGTSQ